jgi:DNA-binding response OmpR family regulator
MSDLYDILLIEDSPTQALRFQLLLQRAGYRVHIIADGAEGWRVACDDLPRLILLDVDLPTMDGFQVLARLKRGRATAKIPIIMLTNREHVSNVIQALEMGADNYLPKPDALEQLQSAVEELLTC